MEVAMIKIGTFFADESGATAIEYGLIASLVSLVGIVAFTALGDTVLVAFTDISKDFCVAIGGTFSLTADGADSCT
jgi:pilus assembly protein Flp/PilA|tara:strand:- start:483 stop:710 length:228 start_codon:yes stop_codon:yes gene_type:complete